MNKRTEKFITKIKTSLGPQLLSELDENSNPESSVEIRCGGCSKEHTLTLGAVVERIRKNRSASECIECAKQLKVRGRLRKTALTYFAKVKEMFGEFLLSSDKGYNTPKQELLFRCCKCPTEFKSLPKTLVYRHKIYPYLSTECPKCTQDVSREKTAKTNIERFGYAVPAKAQAVKDKMRGTNLERYGGVAPACSAAVIAKMKNTNNLLYGCSNAQGNPEVQKKTQATSMSRYGTAHHTQNESVKNKAKETNLALYGFDSYSKKMGYELRERVFPKILERIKDPAFTSITSDPYIKSLGISIPLIYKWFKQLDDPNILPLAKGSGEQKCLENFIKEIYGGTIETNTRKVVSPMELDIYLPELKIAIEYHGLYWHSEFVKDDCNGHLRKRKRCEAVGVQVLQFFSDEWEFKKDIVKSIIRVTLGLNESTLWSSTCEVRPISSDEGRAFLEINHLSGASLEDEHLGMFHDEKLVSVLSYRKEGAGVEITAFSKLLNTTVMGALESFISIIHQSTNPKFIQSFVDLRYGTGRAFERLGFMNKGVTLGWKWTDAKYTYDRRICQTDTVEGQTEEETAESLGLARIYDAGQAKFVLD